MKKHFLKVLMIMVVLFLALGVNISANDTTINKQEIDRVIDMAKPVSEEETQKIKDGEVIKDEILSSKNVDKVDIKIISIEKQKELKKLGFEIDKVQKMEIAKDVLNYTGETYKKFIIDNEHYISIDSDNQIKTIYNAGEGTSTLYRTKS